MFIFSGDSDTQKSSAAFVDNKDSERLPWRPDKWKLSVLRNFFFSLKLPWSLCVLSGLSWFILCFLCLTKQSLSVEFVWLFVFIRRRHISGHLQGILPHGVPQPREAETEESALPTLFQVVQQRMPTFKIWQRAAFRSGAGRKQRFSGFQDRFDLAGNSNRWIESELKLLFFGEDLLVSSSLMYWKKKVKTFSKV